MCERDSDIYLFIFLENDDLIISAVIENQLWDECRLDNIHIYVYTINLWVGEYEGCMSYEEWGRTDNGFLAGSKMLYPVWACVNLFIIQFEEIFVVWSKVCKYARERGAQFSFLTPDPPSKKEGCYVFVQYIIYVWMWSCVTLE